MTNEEVPWVSFHGRPMGGGSSPLSSKRGVVQQLLKGEKTIAELSREFDVSPTIVRDWKSR